MSNNRIELVKSQKNFYQINYHRFSKMLIGALAVILVLSVLLFYMYLTTPWPEFYATSMDGKLVPLKPMNAPNYSSTPLIK